MSENAKKTYVEKRMSEFSKSISKLSGAERIKFCENNFGKKLLTKNGVVYSPKSKSALTVALVKVATAHYEAEYEENLKLSAEQDAKAESEKPIERFKEGDFVRVARKVKSREGEWENTWVPDMDKLIGKVAKIKYFSEAGKSYLIVGSDYYFPQAALDRVNPYVTEELHDTFAVGESVRIVRLPSEAELKEFRKVYNRPLFKTVSSMFECIGRTGKVVSTRAGSTIAVSFKNISHDYNFPPYCLEKVERQSFSLGDYVQDIKGEFSVKRVVCIDTTKEKLEVEEIGKLQDPSTTNTYAFDYCKKVSIEHALSTLTEGQYVVDRDNELGIKVISKNETAKELITYNSKAHLSQYTYNFCRPAHQFDIKNGKFTRAGELPESDSMETGAHSDDFSKSVTAQVAAEEEAVSETKSTPIRKVTFPEGEPMKMKMVEDDQEAPEISINCTSKWDLHEQVYKLTGKSFRCNIFTSMPTATIRAVKCLSEAGYIIGSINKA